MRKHLHIHVPEETQIGSRIKGEDAVSGEDLR